MVIFLGNYQELACLLPQSSDLFLGQMSQQQSSESMMRNGPMVKQNLDLH